MCLATMCHQNSFTTPWHWFYKSLETLLLDEWNTIVFPHLVFWWWECWKSPLGVQFSWDLVTVKAIAYDLHHFHFPIITEPPDPLDFLLILSPLCIMMLTRADLAIKSLLVVFNLRGIVQLLVTGMEYCCMF